MEFFLNYSLGYNILYCIYCEVKIRSTMLNIIPIKQTRRMMKADSQYYHYQTVSLVH